MVRFRGRSRGVELLTCAGSFIALCVWSSPSQPAAAAEVRGQLVLASLAAKPAAKPPRPAFNWEIENGVKEVVPERVQPRELAVVLVGGAASSGDGRLEVSVSGGALLPNTLIVRAETTVRIRNDDEIGHELFAPGLDGFSPEATSPGATRSIRLTKPGSWPLQDRLAVHARAHLHVLADLSAVAKLEANGSYVFADVAPGKYTLKVFRGAEELVSKGIEVTDRPLTVDPMTFPSK